MKGSLILTLFSVLCLLTNAQTNINADCINAIPLCSTPNFTFNSTSGVGTYTDLTNTTAHNISNPQTNPGSSNGGCLHSGELKPQWLLITVGNAGSLEFIFGKAGSASPQAGFYDWAMWPFTPTTCAGIQNNTLPPVRCNWNISSSGGTGIAGGSNIPQGASAGNFEPPLQVEPCQQFIICISNFSGVNTLVSFESVGTASLSCNPNCLNVTSSSLCAGNSATILALSSGSIAGLTYSLQPGGLTSNTPSFVVTPSVSTAYTVYATGVGTQGPVTQTAVSNMTVFPQPALSPTVINPTCTDSTNAYNLNLVFQPPVTPPSYTVNWQPVPSGVGSNHTLTANPPNVVTLPGIYTATVTSEGGCTATGSFTIEIPPTPVGFGFSPAGPVYSVTCYEPTVTVNALQPTYNYTWTNGIISPQNGATAQMDINGTGIWTVTAEHPVSKCVDTRTIMVGQHTVVPTSSLSPGFQNITCSLSSIQTITATAMSPTLNFRHEVLSPLGGTFVSNSVNMNYSPGGVGTFTHYLVNEVNGCRYARTFSISSTEGFPTFSLTSNQNFTLGCNTRSVASIEIVGAQATPTSPGAQVSYTLFHPGSVPVTPPGTLSGTPNYTVNVPGTYTVVTQNNANYCQTRIPVSILSNTVPPPIDTLLIPTNLLTCFTPSVEIRGISSKTNVTSSWELPQNLTQAGQYLNVGADFSRATQTLLATYTFVLEDNSSTCINTETVVMLQNLFPPVPRITGAGTLTCKTGSLLLSNGSTWASANPFPHPKPVASFLWNGPSPQLPAENSSSYVAYQPGEYTMTVRDMNNGCISQTVYAVPVDRIHPIINNPVVPPPDTLDCGATFAQVIPIITSETTALSYQWTTPPGATVQGISSRTLMANTTGIYRLLVTNTLNGCASNVDMEVVKGKIMADFDASAQSGYAPFEITLSNLSASSLGNEGITSHWTFGNGTDTLLDGTGYIDVIYTQPGTYMVQLYVNKGECIDSATKYIDVEIPSAVEVPNVFTPNGDGINDEFFLRTANLSLIEIFIQDRWGRKVYELTSKTGNVLWNGHDLSGKELPDGTYFYILKAQGKDGQRFEKQGTVSLLR